MSLGRVIISSSFVLGHDLLLEIAYIIKKIVIPVQP